MKSIQHFEAFIGIENLLNIYIVTSIKCPFYIVDFYENGTQYSRHAVLLASLETPLDKKMLKVLQE